jgi:two-component system cell cycle response regulator
MSHTLLRSLTRLWRAAPPIARLTARIAAASVTLGLIVRLAAPAAEPLWGALFGAAIAIPMMLSLGRGLTLGRETPAWGLVTLGLVLTLVAGQLGMPGGQTASPTDLGAADAIWLLRYLFVYSGLFLLLRARVPEFGARGILDAVIGAFAAAGLFQLLVGDWIVGDATGTAATVRSLYPLIDVLVIGALGGAAVLNGWPLKIWLPLGIDLALFLTGAALDLHHAIAAPGEVLGWGSYPIFLIAGWCLAAAVFAFQQNPHRITTPYRAAAPPVVLAGAAVVTVFVAAGSDHDLAAALAGIALLAALGRLWLVQRDNDALLAQSRVEALTDSLTGLPNRRAMTSDLHEAALAATADKPLTLAIFDLDGFKHYNDTFGHPAGDALLERLGHALQSSVHPMARAYRMGGDEFCVLTDRESVHSVVVAAARTALSEHGEGFHITASCGMARIPGDAREPIDALRVADGRMYAEKGVGRRKGMPDDAATAALLQVVRERDPALGEHTAEVASWAGEVAQLLGADAETIEQARLGGELHDIGKTAIPDAILDKPGPLTDDEWTFMRRHTLIGERILLADPALEHVAPVARSHHERWTGGGYPDDLRGEDIPLAARIVSVCDAYEAMVADRPYRAGMPHAAAVDELLRCRGSQFDPAVVDAFVTVIAPAVSVSALGATSPAG